MITKIIHDVYSTRIVEDEHGNEIEEDYIIKPNVISNFYIDERDIKAVIPQYDKSGKKYKDRLIVVTSTDSYIIKESFNNLMKVLSNVSKKIGFKRWKRTWRLKKW